jgi:hypothetical protein
MSKQIKLESPVLFEWVAVSVDGKEIQQFPKDQNENSFQTVYELSNNKNLSYLYLIPKRPEYRKHVTFAVNYLTGEHLIQGVALNLVHKEIREEPNLHFRPIHVRRMRQEIGEGMVLINTRRVHQYLLGWQVTVNGKNYQKIIAVDPITASIVDIMEKR